MKPLEGIKVLELGDYVSAPVCGRLMADMGAEVIKVERPEGNSWRGTGATMLTGRFSDDENPVYDLYNAGKKHIVLNLKTDEGKDAFFKLLAKSDVFLTNNRPAALKKMGISYEQLKDQFPRLIYAIVLGYGEKGDLADAPAFDSTAFWSRAGLLLDMAPKTEDQMACLPPYGMGDTLTGTHLLSEISAALFNRTRTGKGDYVIASLLHVGLFAAGTMGVVAQRPWGKKYPCTRADYAVPHGPYRCSDGEFIYFSGGYNMKIANNMLRLIGREDLIGTDHYADHDQMMENREEVWEVLRDAFLTKPADEWVKLCGQYDTLPVGKMNHYADIAEDKQAWANGYLEHVSYRSGNTDVLPSSPIEMASVGELHTVPTPPVGADTEEVLSSL